MFEAAVKSAQPEKTIPNHLPSVPAGRTVVIGAGKASAEMARAFEAHWCGPRDKLSGLIVTRYDYAVECQYIEIVEAAHPVPDQAVGNLPDFRWWFIITVTAGNRSDTRQ